VSFYQLEKRFGVIAVKMGFITRHGDETAFISARNIPVPDKQLMISVVWDVTERKRGEDRIRHLNPVLKVIREIRGLIDRVGDRDTLIHEGCRLLAGGQGYASSLIVLTDENDRRSSESKQLSLEAQLLQARNTSIFCSPTWSCRK
jgi:hypothetical protein